MDAIATTHFSELIREAKEAHIVPRIVSIVGVGRSGSTLIEGYVQKHTGAVGVGELAYIWERGCQDNELCGCGKPFHECDFWQSIIKDAFGTLREADVESYASAFRTARGSLTQSNASMRRPITPDPLFVDVSRALYRSLARQTGGKVLIDSSKIAYFTANLIAADVGDISLLHIIRDPHGVAYSLLNPKPRPQARGGNTTMGKSTTIFHSMARWSYRNAQASALRHATEVPSSIVAYEDFCRDPETVFAEIARVHGLSPRPAAHEQDWHSVSGNPIRFTDQKLTIRLDERWREKMPAHQRLIVSCLSYRQQHAMESEIRAEAQRSDA
jgi:hypothetical protein